jgi:hypothetical protein
VARLHHVKKARKAIPEAGIQVGDSYYFYKRRINGKGAPKICSKAKPRRSAYLTSSPFLKALLDMEDDLQAMVANGTPAEEVAWWLGNAASEVEVLGGDCTDKAASVAGGMKNGSGIASAELLRERADHCSALASALREAASELEAGSMADLSEEESGDQEVPSAVPMAEVVAGIAWLP